MSEIPAQGLPTVKGPVTVVAAVIRNKLGQILIARRPVTHKVAGGLWEFPGGKIEAGETPKEALKREIREELGIEIRVEELIDVVSHIYNLPAVLPDRLPAQRLHILLVGYFADFEGEIAASEFELNDVAEVQWVDGAHRPSHHFAPADVPFLEKVWPNKR